MREEAISAYEMMLSESQERMLMVLRPEGGGGRSGLPNGAWILPCRQDDGDLRFPDPASRHGSRKPAIKELGDEAPEYDRPWDGRDGPCRLADADIPRTPVDEALLKLLASPISPRGAGCGNSTTR